jgi:Glycosyltransferase family 87
MGKPSPLAVLFLVALVLSVIHISGFFVIASEALDGYGDFRHLYTAGYMVRSGHGAELYDYAAARAFQNQLVSKADRGLALPFNHLAYEALLFSPLSLLKYRTAYFTFVFVNLGLLALCFHLLRPHFGDLSQLPRWLQLALPLGFLPTVVAIGEGQDSIVMLALAVVAFALLERNRETEAGAVLALTLFKFQFSIPILILYAFWRRWSFVRGFAISAGAVLALSITTVGPAGVIVYGHDLVSMSAHLSADGQFRYGIHPDLMMNLRGLVYAVAHDRLSQDAEQFVVVVLSTATLIWALTKRPSFPLAVAVAVLVSYHCLTHDAILLFIPLSALVAMGSAGTFGVACAVLAGPTLFLCARHGLYLMALPLVALIALLAKSGSAEPYHPGTRAKDDPLPGPPDLRPERTTP